MSPHGHVLGIFLHGCCWDGKRDLVSRHTSSGGGGGGGGCARRQWRPAVAAESPSGGVVEFWFFVRQRTVPGDGLRRSSALSRAVRQDGNEINSRENLKR
jgi:hypothetical protein